MESNNAPFAVGDEVVCIKSHSSGMVEKGEPYTVLDVNFICCHWVIDVGYQTENLVIRCSCQRIMRKSSSTAWFSASLFRKTQIKYTDITKELCDSVGITEEVPDVHKIKELEPQSN